MTENRTGKRWVGFGEGPALAWELFLIRILVLRGAYGASSFSSSFLAFQSPPGLHVRDVYISINKTRVQRASLEVSPLISITRQFLRRQLTHIYIDRRDTDEKRSCAALASHGRRLSRDYSSSLVIKNNRTRDSYDIRRKETPVGSIVPATAALLSANAVRRAIPQRGSSIIII